MINLIPPTAKKSLVTEYWVRVFSVWGYTWATALLLGVFIMVPSLVLIGLQVEALAPSASSASERLADFDVVTKDLGRANLQARAVVESTQHTSMSDYLELFRRQEHSGVSIASVTIARSGNTVTPIVITGLAENRQALAAFRDRVRAESGIESVDLPISNLAKDRDIPFTMSVSIKTTAP